MGKDRIILLGAATLFVVAVLAVACGDNEEAAPTPTTPAAASPTAITTATEEAEATPTVEALPTEEATPEPTEEIVPTEEPTEEVMPTEPPAPSAQTVDIAMVPSIRFDRNSLAVQSGATVTVRIDNTDDGIPHNFAVYTDSSASQPLAEGSVADICTGPCTEEITFVAPAPGEYFFRCDVHPRQMTGTLVVE